MQKGRRKKKKLKGVENAFALNAGQNSALEENLAEERDIRKKR